MTAVRTVAVKSCASVYCLSRRPVICAALRVVDTAADLLRVSSAADESISTVSNLPSLGLSSCCWRTIIIKTHYYIIMWSATLCELSTTFCSSNLCKNFTLSLLVIVKFSIIGYDWISAFVFALSICILVFAFIFIHVKVKIILPGSFVAYSLTLYVYWVFLCAWLQNAKEVDVLYLCWWTGMFDSLLS